jgi:hypothetical protein
VYFTDIQAVRVESRDYMYTRLYVHHVRSREGECSFKMSQTVLYIGYINVQFHNYL